MAYKYEDEIKEELDCIRFEFIGNQNEMLAELQEVYKKAKAFDEIVIETTGAIMNCPPGAVETEAGRLTLDIIEKYDLEDNQNGL